MSANASPSSEIVVVTGAGAGLGRAIAQAFGRRGARLGLIGRDRDRLETARHEVESFGGRALVLPADVADADAVEAAAARVEAELGPIDVWVNNAMTTVFSPVREMTADDYRRVTEVTYLGFVHGTLAALKRMQPRDRGSIVQVGSALSYRAIPLQSAYCAAKHALVGFTDSLRSELIHDRSHVRICIVHMPALNTPQFRWCKSRMPRRAQPVPPIFQPEVGAEAVYWAAHHDRRELLVGWPTVQAVWGQKFIPGLLDRYLARVGWDGQMYDGANDPAAPNDLYQPVAGDFGAHGDFDARAHGRSVQLWASTHRPLVATALGLAVGALALLRAR